MPCFTEADMPDSPSPFYALVDASQAFTLEFPVDQDGIGPVCDEAGELIERCIATWEAEELELVPLGEGRYRLSSKDFSIMSALRLRWGDEFFAETTADGHLRLLRIILPRRFKHYCFVNSLGFNNENPIAKVVHSFEGGWETELNGLLTLTVPVHAASAFESKMKAEALFPVVFLGHA